MRNELNFNYLECFVHVAESESFSGAARSLKIAQPAVSKQIKFLEEYLDTQLFIRGRKSVSLTKSGKEFYNSVVAPYKEVCNRVDNYKNRGKELSGRITFGCLHEVGEIIFTPRLLKFKKSNSDIKLDIRLMKNRDIISGVKDGEIDLGVVSEKIIQENIRAYKILNEEIILVTNAKNKNKKINKITELPYVSYRDGSPLLNYYISKYHPKTHSSKLNIEVIVNSQKSMAETLLMYPYYSVMPKLSVQSLLDRGALVQVGIDTLVTELYLIYLESEYPSKRLSSLRDYLLKSF